jgi:branched-chain amino acid transport system substrate-binding protein
MTLGKIKLLILFGLTSCLLLTACKSSEPIRIGLVGTMSGEASDLSVSGRRGAEIAIKEINDSGGINGTMVELIVKDDQNNVEAALKVDQELVQDNVNLIIGHYTSGMVLGVIDYINSVDALMLGPTISADQLSHKDDNFIRFIASTKEQAEVLSEDVKIKALESVTVLYDERNKGFTEKLVDNFGRLVKDKSGFDVNVIAYDPSDVNSRQESLEAIKAIEPDGLFVIASAEECAIIAQNLRPFLDETQFYGPLWANTQEILRKGGTFVEDMILVGAVGVESEDDKAMQFKRRFYEQFGEQPTFASVYTYETVMALMRAIKETHSIHPPVIKNKMLEIATFEGIQEEVVIDTFGDNHRRYDLFQIKSGKMQKVKSYED